MKVNGLDRIVNLLQPVIAYRMSSIGDTEAHNSAITAATPFAYNMTRFSLSWFIVQRVFRKQHRTRTVF